jgi:hypothetical protein
MKVAILYDDKHKKIEQEEAANNIFLELFDSAKKIHKIFIDQKGDWNVGGVKTLAHAVLPFIDYVIDLRHSGKDAKLEKLLYDFNIKSILKYNDEESNIRKIMHQIDVDTPAHINIKKDVDSIIDIMHDLWRNIHTPVTVKSENKNLPELVTYNPHEVCEHIMHIHKKGYDAVLDQHVSGKKYSILTIDNYRGEKFYTSPVKEIMHINRKVKLYYPHDISQEGKEKLYEKAKKIHAALDHKMLEHVFVNGKNGPILMSVNSKPLYTKDSSIYTHFKDSGITFADIILSEKVK